MRRFIAEHVEIIKKIKLTFPCTNAWEHLNIIIILKFMKEPIGENQDFKLDKREEPEREIFGEMPAYLNDGLENWLQACQDQAQLGTAGLKKQKRYSLFHNGMSKYLHTEPKDIGAVEYSLQELGKLAEGQNLKMGRIISQTSNDAINPIFETLFASNISDLDLEKAGMSFCMGNDLYENLKTISLLEQAPYFEISVIWREIDYDLNRRKLTDEEFSFLVDAIFKIKKLIEFAKEIMEEYGPMELTEEIRLKELNLKREADVAGKKWWEEFKLANKQ